MLSRVRQRTDRRERNPVKKMQPSVIRTVHLVIVRTDILHAAWQMVVRYRAILLVAPALATRRAEYVQCNIHLRYSVISIANPTEDKNAIATMWGRWIGTFWVGLALYRVEDIIS